MNIFKILSMSLSVLFICTAFANENSVVRSLDLELKSNDDVLKLDSSVSPPDKDVVPTIKEIVEIQYPFIKVGTFKENVERLAQEQGFAPVVWDRRVAGCVWEQIQGYEIPETNPRDVIAYYASTLDFKPVFSDVDTHVQLIYFGPKTRIQHCEN